jgi:hypothetical protein
MLAAAILLGVIVVVQLIALALLTADQTNGLLMLADMQRQERADLLQRIQAPEAAIIQHQVGRTTSIDPPAPSFDDDEAFWESKETLAARLANEAE